MKRLIAILLCLVLFAGLAACGKQELEPIEPFVNPLPEPSFDVPPSSSSSEEIELETEEMKERTENMKQLFSEAFEKNDETLAWITISGTNISYPIFRHDNDSVGNYYYLYKDINGEYSKDGSLFTGYGFTGPFKGNSSEDYSRNMIVFGHNWTNYTYTNGHYKEPHDDTDTMLAQLVYYEDIEFCKENPFIYLQTENETLTYVVAAAYYTDVYFADYVEPNLDDTRFMAMVSEAMDRAEYDTNVEVTTDDKIIQLSTCTRRYPIGDKQRFVVMARLLHEDEHEVTFEHNLVAKDEADIRLPKGVSSR